MKKFVTFFAMVALVLGLMVAQGNAEFVLQGGSGGMFTADIEIVISGVNGGQAFPAVINPDNGFMGDTVNWNGAFYGPWTKPDMFSFSGLPVYAIVQKGQDIITNFDPNSFMPWSYQNSLGNAWYDGAGDRNFSLAQVGTLHMDLITQNSPYEAISASFVYFNSAVYALSGTLDISTPPWNPGGFLWYSPDGINLGGDDLSIVLNNNWSGSPGVVMDKIFFPGAYQAHIPGTLILLFPGLLVVIGRRRSWEL